jgi:hypothetical protein
MSPRAVSRPNVRVRYSYSTITTLCQAASTVDTMSADPRAALNTLVAALERHLEASSARRGEDDPAVIAAYDDLADAFEDYDGALFDAYGEMTPLDIYVDDDAHVDEDGDDAHLYSGLDDDIVLVEEDDGDEDDS